jgi:hypothetical protein
MMVLLNYLNIYNIEYKNILEEFKNESFNKIKGKIF